MFFFLTVSKLFLYILYLDLYLSICCCEPIFFDIVFDVEYSINDPDRHKNERNVWMVVFIILNALILLWCIYVLIFIIIPIIHFRIMQCSRKEPRVSQINDGLESKTISLIKDRFTSEDN